MKDGDDLVAMISSYKPGTAVDIGYLREGKQAHATVTVGDREKVLAAMNDIRQRR